MRTYGYRAETIRAINRKLIFDLVASQGPISRSEIARLLKLSFTAVTDILGDLIQANLIEERDLGLSQGGRPPRAVDIRSDTDCLLGLHFLSSVDIQAVITDPRGTLIGETSIQVNESIKSDYITGMLEDVSRQALAKFQGNLHLLTFGIACSSPVSLDGKVRFLNMNGWLDHELDILAEMEKRLGIPGIIDNDAKLGALAEHRINASSGEKDLCYILIHRGIGAGIIAEGKIFRGHGNIAGEFGHIVIDPDGALCSCGRYGCLESFVSTIRLSDYVLEAAKFGYPTTLAPIGTGPLSTDKIIDAALAGDRACIQGFEELGKWLSLGVVNLVHLFNPEALVFGGPLARAGKLLLEPVEMITRHRLLPDFYASLNFRASTLGAYGPALGAAISALDSLLEREEFISRL